MTRAVLLLALLLAACGPRIVLGADGADIAVQTAVPRTLHMKPPGCTAVDIGGGLVATARHCVNEGGVDWELGRKTNVGVLIYVDQKWDFALLADVKLATSTRPAMRQAVAGEHLYVMGYPAQPVGPDGQLTITDGVYTGVFVDDSWRGAENDDGCGGDRISADLYYGNSGGGVWGEDGALLGLAVCGVFDVPSAFYMTPIGMVQKAL